MTTPEARLQEIQTTIADERARLEEGAEPRLESLAPLLDEATRLESSLEQQGIVLSEKEWQEANERRAYMQYQLQGADYPKIRGMIEAARAQRDSVALFLIAEALPINSAGRQLAERPLVDVKATRQQIRRDTARIRDLSFLSAEQRRKNHEARQALPRVDQDALLEQKRRQLGGL